MKAALGRTLERRPDLLERIELNEEQRVLLAEYRVERAKALSLDNIDGLESGKQI